MVTDVSPAWGLGQSAITATAGLGGVLIGAMMTARNQKKERQNAHIREQLEHFYSPMLGMRAEIEAKTQVRRKINSAAETLCPRGFEGVSDSEVSDRTSASQMPGYDKIFEYDIRQWEEVLMPVYHKMQEHFAAHMWLAAPSTLGHYESFVEFIELWERLLDDVPRDIIDHVGHSGSQLRPFYDDLQDNFDLLKKKMGHQ